MFGLRLASERKRLGMTQKELGERLGIGRSAIGMIETDRAPVDAARLVDLGSDGFDVLYVLAGERGKVAAGRMIDWELCLSIVYKVQAWQKRRGVSFPPEKEAMVIKHLYLQVAERGRIDSATLEETLRMAA